MVRTFGFAILVLCVSGCGTGVAPQILLDGNWRITLTGGQGISGSQCITVSNGTIVAIDDGCIGNFLPILGASPAAVSGDRIVWFVAVTQLNLIEQQFTFDMTVQPDGSLTGTSTSILPALGAASEVTVNIIVNRA